MSALQSSAMPNHDDARESPTSVLRSWKFTRGDRVIAAVFRISSLLEMTALTDFWRAAFVTNDEPS